MKTLMFLAEVIGMGIVLAIGLLLVAVICFIPSLIILEFL